MSNQKITKINSKRSKKYNSNLQKVNDFLAEKKVKSLSIAEAVELINKMEQPNYKNGPTVELHVKLNINPTKSDQLVRSSVVLPHGTGKEIKIAAFVNPEMEKTAKDAGASIVGGEALIDEIKNTQKIEFDIAIAQPDMMKKLPAIARLLGTAGVMPNPKTGTVGDNIEEMIKLIKSGKVDYKNDKTGNLHIPCGKINLNFDEQKLVENLRTALDSIEKAKPEVIKKKYILSAHISTSQSPSVPLDLSR